MSNRLNYSPVEANARSLLFCLRLARTIKTFVPLTLALTIYCPVCTLLTIKNTPDPEETGSAVEVVCAAYVSVRR